MLKEFIRAAKQNWGNSWKEINFRKKTVAGFFMLVIIVAFFPMFFHYIEQRSGYTLNDWLLLKIPAVDISVPIFILIWSTVLLALINAFKNPQFLLTLLYAYCLLCICRYISISMVPLEAPQGLIPLADPLSNRAYGNVFITKDLFFSGHTSTLFLIYLCLYNKTAKYFALAATILTGVFLLIQHVHYTIDVVIAPVFAWMVYLLAGKLSSTAEKRGDQ